MEVQKKARRVVVVCVGVGGRGERGGTRFTWQIVVFSFASVATICSRAALRSVRGCPNMRELVPIARGFSTFGITS